MATEAHVVSINVGLPRIVMNDGEPVSTGIFKEPVSGSVKVRTLNLDGDRQADLLVHGGPDKAVYAYPSEHYDYWKREIPEITLPWGMFGENFTTAGLSESEVSIGDKFRVGSAIVRVTQPRLPCYKLGVKFGCPDIIQKFLASERTGFYFSVLQEGETKTGDALELIEKSAQSVRVIDVTQLYARDKNNIEMLRRAVAAEALPESWKEYFQKRLDKLKG